MRGNPIHNSRKQEWALLYQHQRRQFQQQQLHEQQKQRLRKQAFKQALDQQRYDKRSITQDQRVEDNKYSEFMQIKAKREEEEEQGKRLDILKRRREMEGENLEQMENKKRRHQSEASNVYQIGMEDVGEIRRKNDINKRLLNEELKYQQYEKNQLKQLDRIRDLEKDIANRQFQLTKQQTRLKQLDKFNKYQQNMEVFDLYSKVKKDKTQELRQLQHKMIKEVALQKQQQQQQSKRKQQLEKAQRTVQMKDSLLEQIQIHNKLKQNRESAVKYNNRMYQQFYKDKRPQFDRQEYIKTLNDQMVEENRRKNAHKYMSDEEYKLNANYLEKVFSGSGNSVQLRNDRSAFAIGSQEEVSRRKDDIYFNKLGMGQPREIDSRVSHSSMSKEVKRTRDYHDKSNQQLNPEVAHNDLDLIKQKIDSIVLRRQQAQKIRNRKNDDY